MSDNNTSSLATEHAVMIRMSDAERKAVQKKHKSIIDGLAKEVPIIHYPLVIISLPYPLALIPLLFHVSTTLPTSLKYAANISRTTSSVCGRSRRRRVRTRPPQRPSWGKPRLHWKKS
jgi:hypothetical protein